MRRTSVFAAACLSGVLATGVALGQPTLVLDSFEDQFAGSGSGGSLETLGAGSMDQSNQTGLGSVLGFVRDAALEQVSGASGAMGTISAGNGVLSLSTGPQVEAELTLTYALDSIDVTSGGALDRLSFDVLFSDAGSPEVGPLHFDVTLDDGADSSTQRVTLSSAVNTGTGPVTLSAFLSDFSAEGVDLTSIDTASFVLGAEGTAGDTTIGAVSFVPAPSTAAALGLFGLAAARRRR